MKNIKKEFPIFKKHKKLVYLDSAATTQTCQDSLSAMDFYYKEARANIHRGVYELSGKATKLYEDARDTVATFISANDTEIIFTSGVTHGLNMLAYTLCENLKPGDNVVLTRLEHHANLVPWLEMSKKYGFDIRYIELTNDLQIDTESSKKVIDSNTKIVSFAHISNSIGTIAPVKELISLAKKVGAYSIIDAAQSVAHTKINVKELDCDFLVFSGHKLYGPTGIGVLFGKNEHLVKMKPFFFGGNMIKEVSYESATYNNLPWKFEAGTPNISGAIGLAAAIRFVERVGFDAIEKYDQELVGYCLSKLDKIKKLKHIGPKSSGPVVSFTIEGVHPHDIASILDKYSVAVRAGHHCTMPLMKYLGLNGTTRVSFGVYNEVEDIDRLVEGLQDVLNKFLFRQSM